LWGFDGRAPSDKLFWSNSPKHNYPELMPLLKQYHPAFFDHFVPANDPFKYQRENLGDILKIYIEDAESKGFYVEMLHKSWNPVLQKRCFLKAE
jgi:hypothetical protein